MTGKSAFVIFSAVGEREGRNTILYGLGDGVVDRIATNVLSKSHFLRRKKRLEIDDGRFKYEKTSEVVYAERGSTMGRQRHRECVLGLR